jgi:tRNA U54 and U55 pseudouridine synthase Pus10
MTDKEQCQECQNKNTRIDALLDLVAKLSREVPYEFEVEEMQGQIAKLIAEVGTLRSELRELKSKGAR